MNGWIKHIQMNIALESTKPTQESPSPTQALEYPVYKKRGSKLYGKKWNALQAQIMFLN